MSDDRLQEIRERVERIQAYRATYAGGDLPGFLGDDVSDLLAEVDRLREALADEVAAHAKTFDNFESFAESAVEQRSEAQAEIDRLKAELAALEVRDAPIAAIAQGMREGKR